MFKKSQRYSFKKGVPAKNLTTRLFNLRYQGSEEGEFRCAFVVSSRVDKRSVVRHRLRRRFANALRELTDAKVPFDLVFYIKPECKEKEYVKIKEEIEKALIKAQIK